MLCNRVMPSGALVEASGTRGSLMGNRGILETRHYEKSHQCNATDCICFSTY